MESYWASGRVALVCCGWFTWAELAPAGFPAPLSTSIVAVGSRRGTVMASTSRSLGTLCLVGTERRGGWRSSKTFSEHGVP